MNLPLGFRYAAAYAGIRKVEKDDVALIVPDRPAEAAAIFTTNIIQAAPVQVARDHLKRSGGRISAVLINAGNANCATRTGVPVALASCKAVAKALKSKRHHVIPASTGVIGVELDPKLLTDAIPTLVSRLSADGFERAAEAIMTTDTRVKIAWEELQLRGGAIRVGGMTKGSGMIHPNMATTLGFIMTDAVLPAKRLHSMLSAAADRSYHSLTVDGDMSTNDILMLLASGASKVTPSRSEREAVEECITRVAESLAQQIAADGEGARKLIVIDVAGLRSIEEARAIGRSVANSPLVKTAIAGSDPNWGRILAAAGYAGVAFRPEDIDIYLQGALVCRKGFAAPFDEAELKTKLDGPRVDIRIVHSGKSKIEARFFTCDLTEGYIRINGSYRT